MTDDNPLPNNAKIACRQNDEREAINVGTWINYLCEHGEDQGLVVLADDIIVKREGHVDKPLSDFKTLYTQVGEDDCKTFMDGHFAPMLRCYPC